MGSRDGPNPAGVRTGSNSSTGISEIRFCIVWRELNSDVYESGIVRSRWSRKNDRPWRKEGVVVDEDKISHPRADTDQDSAV